jgi:hypothetical protein
MRIVSGLSHSFTGAGLGLVGFRWSLGALWLPLAVSSLIAGLLGYGVMGGFDGPCGLPHYPWVANLHSMWDHYIMFADDSNAMLKSAMLRFASGSAGRPPGDQRSVTHTARRCRERRAKLGSHYVHMQRRLRFVSASFSSPTSTLFPTSA